MDLNQIFIKYYPEWTALLLVTYLMRVFGSTVFMRQPGTRQAEYELFWLWKVVYHAFEEGYTHSLFWEILLNIALFVPIGALLPLAVDGNEVFGWR